MNHTSKARAVALVIVALVAIGATTASGSETSSDSGSSSGSSSDSGTSKGLGSSDATADVTGPTIVREGEGGFETVSAQVTITNNSSKRSDYFVTAVAESPDHKTRYDETMVSVTALDPGQTSTEKGIFLKDVPADAVVKVTEVQRTASV